MALANSPISYVDPDGRKPLIRTNFKTMKALKKKINIQYSPSTLAKGGGRQPGSVSVSYSKGGLQRKNVLSEATVSQDELSEAVKSESWTAKLSLGLRNPQLIWYKSELEAIDKLSFVAKNKAGTAIKRISDEMFKRIRRKPRSREATKNMMLHVFGQAIITSLFGRGVADFAGDIHEKRSYQPNIVSGNFRSKKEKQQAIDAYVDMINNLYGQELGERLRDELGISSNTIWTRELTARYLNSVQDYFGSEMGWKFKKKFDVDSKEVRQFTELLNEVTGNEPLKDTPENLSNQKNETEKYRFIMRGTGIKGF